MYAATRNDMRKDVRGWSTTQGMREAAIYPVAPDSELTVSSRLSELRSANGAFARSVVQRTAGIRSFIARFAAFLRKSCIYRPCEKSLEEVIRLATTDECFPYTNGDFLDNPTESKAQKCATAAQVQLP
jgi:hypothetical protein